MILFNIGGAEDRDRNGCLLQVRFPSRGRDDDFFEPLAVCRTGALRARRIDWKRNRSAQYEHPDTTRANSSMCHCIHSRTFFRCWWSMPFRICKPTTHRRSKHVKRNCEL